MLVMYTLNNSIASKLPQTSDVKFIDIWIIFGLILHFFILILLITIEHLPEQTNIVFVDESKEHGQQLRYSAQKITAAFARKVLPILMAIFISCYFITACVIFNMEIIDLDH